MRPVQISLPDDLREYANQTSVVNHESLAAYIRRLIIEDQRNSNLPVMGYTTHVDKDPVEKCAMCSSTNLDTSRSGVNFCNDCRFHSKASCGETVTKPRSRYGVKIKRLDPRSAEESTCPYCGSIDLDTSDPEVSSCGNCICVFSPHADT